MSISEINTAMFAAVTAQKLGDYAEALRNTESAYMLICGLPDSEFDNERLEWSRSSIKDLLDYLTKKTNEAAQRAQATASSGGIVQASDMVYRRG